MSTTKTTPTDQELIDAIERFETATEPADRQQVEAELFDLLASSWAPGHDSVCHELAEGCVEGIEYCGRIYAAFASSDCSDAPPRRHIITLRRVRTLGRPVRSITLANGRQVHGTAEDWERAANDYWSKYYRDNPVIDSPDGSNPKGNDEDRA